MLKRFIVLLILCVIALVSSSLWNQNNGVGNAEKTSMALKYLRVSLEKYYQEYKSYPEDLAGNEQFLALYKKNQIDATKATDELEESNAIHPIENFREASHLGGWNYNAETGELRANLPEDCYHQKICWDKM